MDKLALGISILCHRAVCALWRSDPYEWASVLRLGKMRRPSQDMKSWEYREMTKDEKFEAVSDWALK